MAKWKEPAVPRHVVQFIPVDHNGHFLVLHRSNKVRSARNVWSFPSGLHEIGSFIYEEVKRELLEEFDLPCVGVRPIGAYENIAGDNKAVEQYHWVISLLVAQVPCSLHAAVNKEPDKHDVMEILHIDAFDRRFLDTHPFHWSFDKYARGCASYIHSEMLAAAFTIPARS